MDFRAQGEDLQIGEVLKEQCPSTHRSRSGSDKYAIMSDMSSERITIRIPQELGGRLRHRSRIKGQTESDLVREALETYLGYSNGERSAFELAEEAGLIGSIGPGRRSPAKDLSTNPRYLNGFGKDK
jgi:predicted DNA-binding protein